MKKKQARYGKSGGQQSSTQSSPHSDKATASTPKPSRPRRHRNSIHEDFEWGFVSGGNESKFDKESSWKGSDASVASKKPVAKKTAKAAPPQKPEQGKNKGSTPPQNRVESRKGAAPKKSEAVPVRKALPSTLFHSDDWDDDLTLPSYGRTPLRTAESPGTPSVAIQPKEKIEPKRDYVKRPVKEPSAPPKKIVVKFTEPKKEAAQNKVVEKTVAVKPKADAPPSFQRDHKKKKQVDPQYAIPPLPPRERLRWDPEKREYVQDKKPNAEEKSRPVVVPKNKQENKQENKRENKQENKKAVPPTVKKVVSDPPKEPQQPAVKKEKPVPQTKKPDSRPSDSKVSQLPAKRSPQREHPPSKPGRYADPADMEFAPTGFQKLPISETMLDALKVARYLEPTPIQAGVIPPVMKGVDVLGQAQTGTGKTAAFLIPLIEGVEECEPGNSPVALILVPTRELAVQVRDEAVKLTYGRDIRVTACYGGKPIAKNLHRLREGVDIIIGTPGRLLDLMKRGALSCNLLRWVVLDEADRMLDIGFRPDIEKILARTPANRQTLLFSATLPPQVIKLAKKYMIDPEILDFSAKIAVETIEQYYITVDQMRKYDALVQLLKQEEPNQAIIFCRTKRGADRVGRMLESQFTSLATIHGDLAQPIRDKVMAQFRSGTLRYLVATDVVGRGIDVSGISHIINYDIPTFCDDYVHRVGRTGRMGRDGVAYTFVTAEEGSELTRIEMRIDRLLKRAELRDFEAFAKPTDSTIVDPFGPPQGKPIFGKPTRKVRRAL